MHRARRESQGPATWWGKTWTKAYGPIPGGLILTHTQVALGSLVELYLPVEGSQNRDSTMISRKLAIPTNTQIPLPGVRCRLLKGDSEKEAGHILEALSPLNTSQNLSKEPFGHGWTERTNLHRAENRYVFFLWVSTKQKNDKTNMAEFCHLTYSPKGRSAKRDWAGHGAPPGSRSRFHDQHSENPFVGLRCAQ